jgi:AraC family transcriptional regulator, transcriptional activator of pobA
VPILPSLSEQQDAIPLYTLYGEESAGEDAAFIHIESIAARSQLYAWEIDSHTHRGLLQSVTMATSGLTLSNHSRMGGKPSKKGFQ